MGVPRFSVVIPTLNEEKFLPHLLTSLAAQTQKAFEVIVVDGKSKDKTVAVAASYKSTLPLQVIVCDRTSVPTQRNTGATLAKGEWLVFIDADTALLPYFFDRIERFIERERPSFFTPWFRPDSEAGGDAVFTLLANLYVEGANLIKRSLSPGQMTLVKREVFGQVNGYDEAIGWGEDYDLTQRLVAHGVALRILRETLYTHSLRRLRAQGKFKVLSLYSRAAILAILTGKTLRHVSDYMMGGQLYGKKKT